MPEVSVIITDQPCVLIDDYKKQKPFEVIDDKCTGCGNCVDVGCPAIHVTRREKAIKPSGKEVELQFVTHRDDRLHRLRPVRAALRAGRHRPCRPDQADAAGPPLREST